jgi:hypothetical protein
LEGAIALQADGKIIIVGTSILNQRFTGPKSGAAAAALSAQSMTRFSLLGRETSSGYLNDPSSCAK